MQRTSFTGREGFCRLFAGLKARQWKQNHNRRFTFNAAMTTFTDDPIDGVPSRTLRYLHKPNSETDEFTAGVERIYRILRKHHSRPQKLSLALHESGIILRRGIVERVIRRCGDAGVLGFRFFSWASQQPEFHPSPDLYKAMVRMLGKMRQFGAAWAVIDEMGRTHPEFVSVEMFVALMRRFASSRMVGKAVEVLDEMPKYGFTPDGHVFGCLLDALAKNGSVKEAAKLFEDLKVRFPPTIKHYTSLLHGWCKEGKLMEAKFVLIQMHQSGFDPDIVVYNTLLSGYAAAGKMEDGYDLLREMRRKSCNPNAISYTTLIQAFCLSNRMDEAMRLFVEMRRNSCDADVVTYTTLISGFCKWGKIDTAYQLLGSMVQQGCEPNQNTYFHILAAHEKKDQLEECLDLLSNMKRSGCVPDLNIYNVIIRLSCKLGELDQVATMWEELVDGGCYSPGLDTFVILVHGYLEQGKVVEACGYFKEMVSRGLWPSPQYGTLKELLNELVRGGKVELAEEAWRCVVDKGCELNVFAWTIWIHALLSGKYLKEACRYCLEMVHAGFMPQPDTFAKLMKGLKKNFNRHVAAEITEKVKKLADDRKVSFKLYKRRGVTMLNENVMEKREGNREEKMKKMKMKLGKRGGAHSYRGSLSVHQS